MDTLQRTKVNVVRLYAIESFSESDWLTLGQLTGCLALVQNHPRLFRAMSFGDGDYEYCAAQVLGSIFDQTEADVDEVVDHFDIGVWYQRKDPDKYRKLFLQRRQETPTFWKPDCLKLFVSHLSKDRRLVSCLKSALGGWGVSCFIAHQDIEPTREWQSEIETALATMDVLVAVLEPGFRESEWTDQEVGYAFGRGVDVVPLLFGIDAYGFAGRIQGIQAKSKLPTAVAEELALVLLRKPRHRKQMLIGMAEALITADSEVRRARIRQVDGVITNGQMKGLLEGSGLLGADKADLADICDRVGAFRLPNTSAKETEDVPF